ncbi:MAG: DNA polymerase IV, partial [FCB group bacterium]|nr:DNA polymerase IV [FCB group bacterium]
MDAFFCAVEVLKNPDLAGKPVVVGGRAEDRGVVAAASYPARKWGIHSAMPMTQAKKLCSDLIILPPHFKLYKTYSRVIMGILKNESPLIEKVSVDEAYLDLSPYVKKWDEGVAIAKKIQTRIVRDIGLSSSVGIATNKMVAKIASDFQKPAGFTVVLPGEERTFLAPLPVSKIPGIGAKTSIRLAQMGIQTIGELSGVPERILQTTFGKMGLEMARWAKGVDERPVVTDRERKSFSQERTFPVDITDDKELLNTLRGQSIAIASFLKTNNKKARTFMLKIRYSDFKTHTYRRSLTS